MIHCNRYPRISVAPTTFNTIISRAFKKKNVPVKSLPHNQSVSKLDRLPISDGMLPVRNEPPESNPPTSSSSSACIFPTSDGRGPLRPPHGFAVQQKMWQVRPTCALLVRPSKNTISYTNMQFEVPSNCRFLNREKDWWSQLHSAGSGLKSIRWSHRPTSRNCTVEIITKTVISAIYIIRVPLDFNNTYPVIRLPSKYRPVRRVNRPISDGIGL